MIVFKYFVFSFLFLWGTASYIEHHAVDNTLSVFNDDVSDQGKLEFIDGDIKFYRSKEDLLNNKVWFKVNGEKHWRFIYNREPPFYLKYRVSGILGYRLGAADIDLIQVSDVEGLRRIFNHGNRTVFSHLSPAVLSRGEIYYGVHLPKKPAGVFHIGSDGIKYGSDLVGYGMDIMVVIEDNGIGRDLLLKHFFSVYDDLLDGKLDGTVNGKPLYKPNPGYAEFLTVAREILKKNWKLKPLPL